MCEQPRRMLLFDSSLFPKGFFGFVVWHVWIIAAYVIATLLIHHLLLESINKLLLLMLVLLDIVYLVLLLSFVANFFQIEEFNELFYCFGDLF
jgi:hypothetical protein